MMLKAIWRFCLEWLAPFAAAGFAGFLLVGIGCAIAGVECEAIMVVAMAGGTVIGIGVLLVPPVRRWFAKHARDFDPGSGWT